MTSISRRIVIKTIGKLVKHVKAINFDKCSTLISAAVCHDFMAVKMKKNSDRFLKNPFKIETSQKDLA
jgi:hypothetical protein